MNRHQGLVFSAQLLFRDCPEFPPHPVATQTLSKRLGDLDEIGYSNDVISYGVRRHRVRFREGEMPPTVNLFGAQPFETKFSEIEKSQMWNCSDTRDEILARCRYQIIATDMLAAGLPAAERAELDMDFVEGLLELFPTCEAVYFQFSGNLMPADSIRFHRVQRSERFIYLALNVRFFNIVGGSDRLVDTLGMSVLGLPDIQYHFHGMNPDWVVRHAFSLASYVFANDNPIESGETVSGVGEGELDPEVRWTCRFEESLLEPKRPVIDVEMGEYASGTREEAGTELKSSEAKQ